MPDHVLTIEATGEVSHEDYRDWRIPRAEAMMGLGPVRMLCVLSAGFTGFDLRAMADDAGFGLRHRHDISQIAFVSDHPGLNTMVSLFKPYFHGEVRVFRLRELDQAKEWIRQGTS